MAEEDKVKKSSERSCQDVFMLILFLAFWVAEIAVIGVGFAEGHPKRLVYPMDYKGQLCGVDDAVKHCKYVAWMNVGDATEFVRGQQQDICVPACAGNSTTTPFDFSCYPDNDFTAGVMQPDREYFHRCIPTKLTEEVKDNVKLISDQKLYSDLQKSFGVILLCLLISIGLSFVWLELIKRWASVMIWASLFALMAICISFLVYMYREGAKRSELGDTSSSDTFQNAAIVFTVLFVILLCMLVYLRKSISLTGELMEEAAAAVEAMPLLVVFPLLPLIVMLLFFILWFFAALAIVSSGDIDPTGDQRFVMDTRSRNMFGFHVFALVWNLLFIVAIQDTTVAGAVATWYYTRDKNNLGNPISTAFYQTLRYNAGSVAFGSLLVAIVKILTYVFAALKKSAERTGQNNKIASFYFSCAMVSVKFFEKFVEFITRNALIHVAIYNTSFCVGARESFVVIARNVSKVAAVNTVGDFFLFVCKISVSALSSLVCVVILQNHFESIENRAAPALIVFFLSYIVGCNFFGTIEMSIDTILVCFCHEEDEINKNSNYVPYMSNDLKEFIEKHQPLAAKVGDEAKPSK